MDIFLEQADAVLFSLFRVLYYPNTYGSLAAKRRQAIINNFDG
jgi:hypothetical protein